jgi:hypothetical protein
MFVEVTEAAGLGAIQHHTGAVGDTWMPETFGAGGSFVDYDSDGWVDIALAGGGLWADPAAGPPAIVLYRNEGNGRFRDVTAETGLAGYRAYGFGVSAADVDNDSDTDLFLTALGRNLFFLNNGARFTEAGAEAGLAGDTGWCTSALFFDANRDGWVDLYVGRYVPWTPPTDIFCSSDGQTKDYCTPHQYEGLGARFYRNDAGRFVEWTKEAGLADNPGKTLGVAEYDINRDGWPDIVVANDTHRNLLYENRGDGTFREIGVAGGVAYDDNGRARAGMGIDIGVLDASGQPSIVIGNFSDEMVAVYRRGAGGMFLDRAPASGIGRPSRPVLTFGVSLFDAESDGDLDVALANGHILEGVERLQDGITYRQPPHLYLNDGDGRFARYEADELFRRPLLARGSATADIDRDGDVDLLLTENGGPLHLWRNETLLASAGGPHALRLTLFGRVSNRGAIGSHVEVVAGGRTQERRVRTGGSYLSQSESALTFGLAGASRLDTLRIEWPSGRVEVFTDVEADREIRIAEGTGAIEEVSILPVAVTVPSGPS